jgi:hypothetical protein
MMSHWWPPWGQTSNSQEGYHNQVSGGQKIIRYIIYTCMCVIYCLFDQYFSFKVSLLLFSCKHVRSYKMGFLVFGVENVKAQPIFLRNSLLPFDHFYLEQNLSQNTQLNPFRVFKARGVPFFYYSPLFRHIRYTVYHIRYVKTNVKSHNINYTKVISKMYNRNHSQQA